MDQPFSSDDPTIGEALAVLDQKEAALGAEVPGSDGQVAPANGEDSGANAEPAGKLESEAVQPPAPKPGEGTPATPDKAKPGEVKPEPGDKLSKFARNQQRLEGGWKQLNEQKSQLSTREQAIAKREAEIAEKEQAIARKAQANAKPPEYYEGEATRLEAGAAQAEQQAESAEAAGDFDRADRLRKQASRARVLAEMAKEQGAHIRANPPLTDKQAEEAFAARQKEWGTKAALDYPDCFKTGADGKPGNDATRLLQETLDPKAKGYNPLVAKFVGEHPEAMYHLAQFAKAMADAASVPTLTKELATAHAEIKKLQQKLNVPIDAAAGTHRASKTVAQMSDKELEESLRAELAAAGQQSTGWDR